MPRLAIVLSHPTQYYSPWFRWLQANTSLTLRVFYLWNFGVTAQHDPQFGKALKWDIDLLSGYDHEFVPNTAPDLGTHRFGGLHNPTLRARLVAWKPDTILLFGYAYRTHLGLILRPPAPLIFRGDSHLIDQAVGWRKRFVLRRLFARFAAITYVGQANRDYFRTFGVPDSKLHFAPHAVDGDRFAENSATRATAAALKSQLGLGSRRVVLFAGKFVPAKQPVELLQAFLNLAPANAALVFVGDGEERTKLETLAATRPDCVVRFLPFANQSEMPARYALADVFVLPSRGLYETWGLAVNEAMHGGVPCLVSDRVGCQRDLVTEGVTGWVFRAPDSVALQASLQRALETVQRDPASLKPAIAERIAGYSYAAAARGLEAAVAQVIAR